MTQPADWERLRALFEDALASPPEERSVFLDEHINGNDTLRREIESLLAAHDAARNFLDGPRLWLPCRCGFPMVRTSSSRRLNARSA